MPRFRVHDVEKYRCQHLKLVDMSFLVHKMYNSVDNFIDQIVYFNCMLNYSIN